MSNKYGKVRKRQTASKILDSGNLEESIVLFHLTRLATLCHLGKMMGEVERQRLAIGTAWGTIAISY